MPKKNSVAEYASETNLKNIEISTLLSEKQQVQQIPSTCTFY